LDEKTIELFVKAAMKTGKVVLGQRASLRALKSSKLVIVSSSLPSAELIELEAACKSADVPLVIYRDPAVKLGAAAGKPFPVTALSVKSAGDADLRRLLAAEVHAEQKA
jgi:ribosomal protein L30E